MLKKSLCIWLVTAIAVIAAPIARDNAKVADVAAGKIKEARLSWWGFNPEDSTAILEEALASKATTLIVDKTDTPWITSKGLFLKDDFTLIFEDGAEILAKRNAFKGLNDNLVRIIRVNNVTIKGLGKNGGTLRMWKADYQGPDYTHGEWRHTLGILSSENITIEKMNMVESGGDGIYVGVSGTNPRTKSSICKNIVIRDCVCDKNHRQGISIISAVNLLIENTKMTNTVGTPPQAGIDFEPNLADEPLTNCVLRNCYTSGNKSNGYEFYLPNMDTNIAGPVDVTLENCVSDGDKGSGCSIATTDHKGRGRSLAGTITVKNCTFKNAESSSMTLRLDVLTNLKINVVDTLLRNGGRSIRAAAPFYVIYKATSICEPKCPTVVNLKNVVIEEDRNTEWLRINDAAGVGNKSYHIQGNATYKSKAAAPKSITLTPAVIEKMFPFRAFTPRVLYDINGKQFQPGTFAPVDMTGFKPRSFCPFWIYGRKDRKLDFTLHFAKLTSNTGKTTDVVVVAPSGKKINLGKIDFQEHKKFSFTPEETGIYTLDFSAGNNWAALEKVSTPAGFRQIDINGFNFIATTGNLYFHVPEKSKNVAVSFMGQPPGEGQNADVITPDGKLFASCTDIADVQEVNLGENPQPGIWTIKLKKSPNLMLEDFNIILINLPPYLSTSKNALPIVK